LDLNLERLQNKTAERLGFVKIMNKVTDEVKNGQQVSVVVSEEHKNK